MSSTIDAKEIDLIRKFRNRVTDVVSQEKLQNDHFLVRWLRARDYDLEKAEAMLRKSMAWHRRNETDTILAWKPVQNYYRYAMLGHDAEGCPVFLMPVGYWDLRVAVDAGDIVPSFRFLLRILIRMEFEMKLASKKFGKPVSQVVLVADMQHFSYGQIKNRTVVQGAIEFFRIFEAHFPEFLKKAIIINTARIFPLVLAIIKPFMSKKTLGKIEFYGPQKTKWQSVLEDQVPMEILPEYYGGSREGSDEFCTRDPMWNFGDNDPLPGYYFGTRSVSRSSSNLDLTESSDGMKREEIKAGSKLEFEFPISPELIKSGVQLLKWQVTSESYDIGFQVTYTPRDNKQASRDVVDYHRIDSHVTPNEGSLVCDKPGVYTLILDNSYSKRRKKVVHHNVFISGKEYSHTNTLQIPNMKF